MNKQCGEVCALVWYMIRWCRSWTSESRRVTGIGGVRSIELLARFCWKPAQNAAINGAERRSAQFLIWLLRMLCYQHFTQVCKIYDTVPHRTGKTEYDTALYAQLIPFRGTIW